MERRISAFVGAVSGLMLGLALSACVPAASGPHAPAAGERRAVHAILAPAAIDRGPVSIPGRELAPAGARSRGRGQPADARRALRPSHPRPSAGAASELVHAEVERRARGLDAPLRARIAQEILAEAARARLDPLLVVALIHVESSFDPDAISTAGAAGLMQLREATMGHVAARSELRTTDPLDPVANIQAGVRYLAALVRSFGDPELALMAYNAGPGRIRRYLREGGVPERFWAYPRSVARELDRLGGSLDRIDAPEQRLALNDRPWPRR